MPATIPHHRAGASALPALLRRGLLRDVEMGYEFRP